jgi:squalene synthase HpnC
MKFSAAELAELATPSGGQAQHQSTVAASFDFCKRLAESHYENFPVASVLVPKRLRRHFHSIYAFARIADDIADEPGRSREERLQLLTQLEDLLLGRVPNAGNPVITALHVTMNECSIPPEPLQRLLVAFRGDSVYAQPETMQDLERYCSFSANPVGELVLRLYGLWNEARQPLSDAVCTGLQLANFWQDISRDRSANDDGSAGVSGETHERRVTIPTVILGKYDLSTAQILAGRIDSPTELLAWTRCLEELYSLTGAYFARGRLLLPSVPMRLRLELALTIAGGETILNKTRTLGGVILYKRPTLQKRDIARLTGKALRIILSSFA